MTHARFSCRRLIVVFGLALGLGAHTAAADDEACPMDATMAAGGTWSTRLAETIDACLADPACMAGRVAADSPKLVSPPATRSPRGPFAVGSAMLGARARGLHADASAVGDAHVQFVAGGRAGWHRGLQVCGRTAIDAGARTSGRTGLGLAFPHTFWATSLGFEQDWRVQPALSAPRQWLRRAYTSNRATFGFQVATWRGRDGGVSSVAPIRREVAWQDQRAAAGARARLLDTMSGAAYERVDERGRLAVVPWSVATVRLPLPAGADPSPDAMALASSWLAQVGVLELDRRRADGGRLELAASYLGSSAPLDCRGCLPVTGVLGLTVPRDRDRWQVRAQRAAYLAFDDVVTIEDRVTAGWERPRARHALRAQGFAAATRITPAASRKVDVTGGVTLALDLAVGLGLTMTTEVEVARSFYAQLDGALAPVAEPAARVGVVVARHFAAGR